MMKSKSLGIQLQLLARMSASYRACILADIGMSEAEALRVGSTCTLRLPEQLDSDVETYSSLLGQPTRSEEAVRVPVGFEGSTAHHFLMPIWPDLYWTVNSRPDGTVWGVGFRNQCEPAASACDPAVVRRGVWTRSSLESIASRVLVHDGWDEEVVLHLEIRGSVYEARFVFGLLQDWVLIDDEAAAGQEST